ncbi:ceramide-1-phosphate transfer protein isoform X2 [Electrophorus electricus]|uniref:ceramide-1-phosphate transfer protein isoform X2 n=1 Tax=Electrophorus electricus TaxID=8005 RepID=UPI0015D05180|nr:ceramide-1-phosphate transfer protein isoform X2 [Electrophorus electricus]XP_035377108.1 ceramide-1-phosphate transfer protein isoform X2 [Electrophorus electricus]
MAEDRRGSFRVYRGISLPRVPSNNSDDNKNDRVNKKAGVIGECPGQKFQVSRLLFHLNSALGPASDVLLEPYLLCWEELIRFMDALGPLVGFFTSKVQEKITLIRQLSEDAEKICTNTLCNVSENPLQATQNPQHDAYFSVRSMLEAELQRGLVNFNRQTASGSRTLLRLHRSLLWLQLLLEKLGAGQDGRSLGELCGEAYSESLAPYHPWLLQQAAQLVFQAMPEHDALLQMVCVRMHEEAQPIMHTIVAAIREVRLRTHTELEQRNMLDLP